MVSSTTAKHRGEHGNHRLAPVPAQVGPGHGEQETPFPARFPAFLRVLLPLGVAHRLNRGHLRRHPARLSAGQEHRHQGEQGGGRKEGRG